MTVPVEHQWYLARYVADDMRGETRNVGVVLRAANIDLPRVRLLDPIVFLRSEHREEYAAFSAYWAQKVWRDHGGAKPFHWLVKPSKHSPHFFWQFAGSRICTIVDFDQMFELLVKPEGR